MKNVYGIKALRIRSSVIQQKVTRELRNRYGYGALRRPQAQKKMTIEMVEPFVWPEMPEDQSAYVQYPSQTQFLHDVLMRLFESVGRRTNSTPSKNTAET